MGQEYNISIMTSKTLEFASALYILGNNRKSVSLSQEIGFVPDQLLFDLGEACAKAFSKHLEREAYFFMLQDACSMTGMTPLNALPFAAALDNPDISGVPELIDRLEHADEKYLLYLLAKSAVGLKTARSLKAGLLEEYAETLPPEDRAFREKFLDCVKNPHETKVRFCLLLRQFYELAYRTFEDAVGSLVEEKRPYYVNLLETDPVSFTEDFLKLELQDCGKKLDICLSLFMQIGLQFIPGTDGCGTVLLGIRSDQRFGAEVTRNRLKSFYKLLSDEKRFQLLELLSQSPKYVNELAELLDLSPPTVSHHLGYFIRAGIVSPSREEHKLYYALDRKKVRDYFERSIKMFVKE